ncbi:MAG: flagellar hook-associated protein FlgK [Selenomonas sp.]|jgi:flagellar hook-associated protein 1 FlgK|nr:flagellar hook-associated protein FlgK [Selenomonas sp.]
MRSTFSGLNTMVRGISGNQLSLDTVGHNITNASTTGYSRQSVNLAATRAQATSSLYGDVLVGSGVDSTSIQRARNTYADKQFWSETATQNYYKTKQTNYDKVEAVFDDSDNTGIQNTLKEFYSSWSSLSTSASTSSNRVSVISKAQSFIDSVKTASKQLQNQITSNYDELSSGITKINNITSQITQLNQNIMTTEANGASANDLRDQRDNLVDDLSKYTNLNVYEDSNGMYSVVSNGVSLVNGVNKLTLQLSDPIANSTYGVNDYNIQIKEANTTFMPTNGILKSLQDTIAEDKTYIDGLANISATMMTTFNTQHQQGAGIDSAASSGLNFFGSNEMTYTWDASNNAVVATATTRSQTSSTTDGVTTYTLTKTQDSTKTTSLKGINIINAMTVASELTAADGQNLIAARALTTTNVDTSTAGKTITTFTSSSLNGTADGTNAVNISALFNMDQSNTVDTKTTRAIGEISINNYYNSMTSHLGSDSETMDDKASSQDDLITQITNWRSSTSGVDWNEELTNMIKFQQGYSACSRCLTTMDEMLDKLVNSTGTVGR